MHTLPLFILFLLLIACGETPLLIDSDESSSDVSSESSSDTSISSNEEPSSSESFTENSNSSESSELSNPPSSENSSSDVSSSNESSSSISSESDGTQVYWIFKDAIDGEDSDFTSDHLWNDPWNKATLPAASINSDATEGEKSILIEFTPALWSGFYFNYDGSTKDLSDYRDGYLKLDIKTTSILSVGMENSQTIKGDVNLNDYAELNGSWESVVIPLDAINGIELSSVSVPLSIISESGGKILIDNIRLANEGTSTYSKYVPVVPDAPSNIATTVIDDTAIDIEWSDNSDNETGFIILWSKSDTKPTSINAQVAVNVSEYSITGLSAGTEYTIWVSAIKNDQVSESIYETATTSGVVATGLNVNIMSFNVRVPVDAYPHDWASRRSRVAAVVNTYQPDVVGFQEMVPYQRDDVRGDTGYEMYGIGRDCGGGEGTFIGYKSDLWTIDESNSGNFWFSSSPDDCNSGAEWDGSYKRMSSYVRLVHKTSGEAFYLFNGHWTYIRDWRQENHAELLADKVAARGTSDPWLSTGDFNTTDENNAYKYLVNQWTKDGKSTPVTFEDTYRTVHNGIPNNSGTFSGFGTGPNNGHRIDFIFAEENSFTVNDAYIIYDSFDGYGPSDHFPIMAEVILY